MGIVHERGGMSATNARTQHGAIQRPSPIDTNGGILYPVKTLGQGKTVQNRRGPAAVTGDESRTQATGA